MKKTVCVAMSGGVDSAVAALLLTQSGYEVIGAFMKNWSLAQEGVQYHPWEEEAGDAEAVCKQLGIPFHVFDFEEAYQARVVNEFVKEYGRGRTPNPDVLCNKEVKFDLFMKKAREFGASHIATGHYARVRQINDQYILTAGLDGDKDQSYFLYTLTQKELPHILFPIGHLRKIEVRAIARKYGLPNADKKDSQGICFIGPVTMRRFLAHYLKAEPGNVISPEGKVIGQHEGIMFYTEGQRHGFDTSGSHVPLYVAEKRQDTNELVVAPRDHPSLYSKHIGLESVTWVGMPPPKSSSSQARVRYRQPLHRATLIQSGIDYEILFSEDISAVSLGQSVVLYDGDTVLGGGIISARLS